VINTAPPKKRGYAPKPIDIDVVGKLASIQCTYEEIAAVIGIKKRQFIDRINADPALREAIDEGWANGRSSIRRAQVKMLEAGNATMGIWLGKQYLGQRDQIGITGGDGGPVKHSVDPFDALSGELSRIARRDAAKPDTPKIQ
jgi:hypothetical protein